MDLQMFFQQWLYQGGNIMLKGTWSYDAKRKKVKVIMEQVQNDYTFRFPVEIGIWSGTNKQARVETISMDQRTVSIEIDADIAPEQVELDPATKLLATWDFKRK